MIKTTSDSNCAEASSYKYARSGFWNPDFLEGTFNQEHHPKNALAYRWHAWAIASKSITERSAPQACIGMFGTLLNDFNRKSSNSL